MCLHSNTGAKARRPGQLTKAAATADASSSDPAEGRRATHTGNDWADHPAAT